MAGNAPSTTEQKVMTNPFDLVFYSNNYYRNNKGKPQMERQEYDGYEDGLYEFIDNAGLFPLNFMMDAVLEEIDDATTINDPEGKYRMNFTSIPQMLINSPRYATAQMQKYRMKRKWARIGGFVSSTMDGATFSLMAHRLGTSQEESKAIGRILSDPLDQMEMRYASPLIEKEVERVNDDAFNLTKGILRDDFQIAEQDIDTIFQKAETEYDTEEQKRQYIETSLKSHNVDDEIAETISQTYSRSINPRELRRYSKEIALRKLALQHAKDPTRHRKTYRVIQELQNGTRKTAGVRAVQTMNTAKYIFDGDHVKDLINGDFEKLGLVQSKELRVVDENGDTTETIRMMLPRDTVMGRAVGRMHYVHPKNFVKNFILKGDGWLLLAKKKDTIDKKSFGYLMYQLVGGVSIINPISRVTSVVQTAVSKAFTGFKKRFGIDSMRKLLTNVLTKIFPAALPGVGLLVNFVLTWFDDQISQLFMQIIMIALYGAVGFFIILFAMISPPTPTTQILNSPFSSSLDTDGLSIGTVTDKAAPSFDIFNAEMDDLDLSLGKAVDGDDSPVNPFELDLDDSDLDIGRASDPAKRWSLDDLLNWNGDTSGLSKLWDAVGSDAEEVDLFDTDPDDISDIDFGEVVTEPEGASKTEIAYTTVLTRIGVPADHYREHSDDSSIYYEVNGYEIYETMLISDRTYEDEVAYWDSYFEGGSYEFTKHISGTVTAYSASKSDGDSLTVYIDDSPEGVIVSIGVGE